jgi:hypothetical protein
MALIVRRFSPFPALAIILGQRLPFLHQPPSSAGGLFCAQCETARVCAAGLRGGPVTLTIS